jgi:signal transduction histidine kinase
MADPELSSQSRTAMREVVVHIIEQAELMSSLIEEILDVQRVQLGKLPLEVSHVDLAQLAKSAGDEVAQTTPTHAINVDSTEPLPPVEIDRRRIRQVLVNLLENAVKYSDHGEILVTVGRENVAGGPMAVLSVSDHGIGLEAGDLDRIFDRFVQASSGPVRGHAGLGLGLYVARQIARAHGGDVWAESAGRGLGSTFYLRLPLESRLGSD